VGESDYLDWDGFLVATMDLLGKRVVVQITQKGSDGFPLPFAAFEGVVVDAAGGVVIEGRENEPRALNVCLEQPPGSGVMSFVLIPDWKFQRAEWEVREGHRVLDVEFGGDLLAQFIVSDAG
jgi:hypothetical protein